MTQLNVSPDAATGTTTAKRPMDTWEWMKLASEFGDRMEVKIREDFEKYVEHIRVSTNGFRYDKLDDIEDSFNWKHEYEYEWGVFIKEFDEDLLCDALKYYKENTDYFINDNYVLGRYLKELAGMFDVEIGFYREEDGDISVYIIDKVDIYKDVVRISDFICEYVADYREKMQRGEEEYTDTVHIDRNFFSNVDKDLLEDEDFTELVNWRVQEQGCMIDNISVTESGVDVYIDC